MLSYTKISRHQYNNSYNYTTTYTKKQAICTYKPKFNQTFEYANIKKTYNNPVVGFLQFYILVGYCTVIFTPIRLCLPL